MREPAFPHDTSEESEDERRSGVKMDAFKGVRLLMQVISKGMRHRKVGSHELNLESSRSHSIMTVYCDCTTTGEEPPSQVTGKISFVDLAGSERLKDSKSCGDTLKETSSINRSLFTLGKVTLQSDPLT